MNLGMYDGLGIGDTLVIDVASQRKQTMAQLDSADGQEMGVLIANFGTRRQFNDLRVMQTRRRAAWNRHYDRIDYERKLDDAQQKNDWLSIWWLGAFPVRELTDEEKSYRNWSTSGSAPPPPSPPPSAAR